MKQVVIFDFDGTLANSISLVIRLYNAHAEHFKVLPVDESEIPQLRAMARDGGYKKVLKSKKISFTKLPAIVLTIGREMRQHMHEVKPYPGMVVALQELKAQGYRLGVLTSNQEPIVREFLETHQYPLFDFIVSEKTLFGKERALRKIMKKFALDTRGVVYVGDEPRDISASRKAGVASIGVAWGLAGADVLQGSSPDRIILHADELVPTVKEL